MDQNFSGSDNLFVRYTVSQAAQTLPVGYPQFSEVIGSRIQFATLTENHIFSPNFLNTFRFSFSRTFITDESPSEYIGPQFSFVPGKVMGSIGITGFTSFSTLGTAPNKKGQNIFTWSDDMAYTRARHSLKFGTLINRYQQYNEAGTNSKGSISFPNLSSFLQGLATNYSALSPDANQTKTYFFTNLGFYVHDDFRLNSRLTLNLGLRYEFVTIPQEVRGLGSALRDIQHDAEATLSPEMFGKNPTTRNWSPRFGFAWDVFGNGMTAVRGGFGLLYDVGQLGHAIVQATIGTPPYANSSTVQSATPFPVTSVPFVFPPGAAVGRNIRIIDYNMQQPHLMQYNLSVERQLPYQMALTLGYAGSRGINLVQFKEGNPTVPQVLDGKLFWPVGAPRTNPNWGNALLLTAGGNSWYNGMQIGLNKRLSRGLQFQGSYTWSKVIDEVQGQLPVDNTGGAVDGVNRHLDRGPTAFDTTQNFSFNAIYRFPAWISSGGFLETFLNGWWMSSIVTLRTGPPFDAGISGDRARKFAQNGANRPDLLPSRSNDTIVSGTTAGCRGVTAGRKLGTPNLYFDPCAFALQPLGYLGNAGRNILRGPGFANLNFSLVKDTALGFLREGTSLQFRAEFFNILNHSNFSVPSANVFSSVGASETATAIATAGRITNTVGESRRIQLALKILF